MESNFLMGGKLGDFLHAMFAVKNICEQTNVKANIYMYDIGWDFGIYNTCRELEPILLAQTYVNSVNVLTEYELDPVQTSQQSTPIKVYNKAIQAQGYLDLGAYIRSPWLYKTCWSELYSKTFNFILGKEYRWIVYDKVNTDLKDKVLIQRKANSLRNSSFNYSNVVDTYGKENCIFISSTEQDYQEFPNKQDIPFYKINSLVEWFTAINSSSLVVANLSAPAVMAHALDKPRIIELPYTPDAYHCMGEERYSNNVYWYLTDAINKLS